MQDENSLYDVMKLSSSVGKSGNIGMNDLSHDYITVDVCQSPLE